MKKIIALLIILLALTGCSNQETTVCSVDEKELTSEITFKSEDDIVKKMIDKVTIKFEQVGISEESQKEEFVNEIRKTLEFIKSVEGVSFEDEVSEEAYTYSAIINYDIASASDLAEIGILSKDESDAKVVSLEKSIANLKTSGYTCENK